ncbi:AraC family transcriptional regulator [Pedobacter antarcticus 4BY]|uniref:AraC family transcriptional regulator n=3 Tax=Pedobacter antarcticus TaxID=34086 RepID=A0A081PDG3_9SPHI|nr:AraC family transcriptional regulator [Pedobacter antarcticus]KEQ28736.1 AraC family transcriptional regulator [Pedobacter antarcticus 4BY]SDL44416.1 AraC-type DNA-binding protein [Pedobacter antarcticus]SFE40268.1 transcriptional regulator, AraC family [Pedobacter antarcticus]
MQLHIKNMVCDRCILIVGQQLKQLGFEIEQISLGLVNVEPEPNQQQRIQIASAMQVLGFELIDKEKDKLTEQIKNQVISIIHQSPLNELKQSPAQLVAERLNKDYAYLSRLFSEIEGTTIEKYIIQQKVEKVKELLEYGEYNLSEIAFQMGYSSSAHLSTQFKSVTGLSPSKYKALPPGKRKPLDQVI